MLGKKRKYAAFESNEHEISSNSKRIKLQASTDSSVSYVLPVVTESKPEPHPTDPQPSSVTNNDIDNNNNNNADNNYSEECIVLRTLKTRFGFNEFRSIQKQAIDAILYAKKDVLLLMPTGGGKSLCFQLPALALNKLGIVISPLIALMKNHCDALNSKGIHTVVYNSSISQSEKQQTLLELKQHLAHLVTQRNQTATTNSANNSGNTFIELLYTTPETLKSNATLRSLLQSFYTNDGIALFAIDECHCISSWGHDFRPAYRDLSELRVNYPRVPIMAVTATATPMVRKDILKQLQMASKLRTSVIVDNFDRPNLYLLFKYVDDLPSPPKNKQQPTKQYNWRQHLKKSQPYGNKQEHTRKQRKKPRRENRGGKYNKHRSGQSESDGTSDTFNMLNDNGNSNAPKITRRNGKIAHDILQFVMQCFADSVGLIYVFSRKDAEQISAFLKNDRDFLSSVDYYHAGLSSKQRTLIQNNWENGTLNIVVCTCAFGMGIDKSDVRFIIHANITSSLEAYYQEIGRAGRDGKNATVICYYDSRSLNMRKRIAYGDCLRKLKSSTNCNKNNDNMRVSEMPLYQRKMEQIKHVQGFAEPSHCRRRYILEYLGDFTLRGRRQSSSSSGGGGRRRCCDFCDDPEFILNKNKKYKTQRLNKKQRKQNKKMGTVAGDCFVPLDKRSFLSRKQMAKQLKYESFNDKNQRVFTKEDQISLLNHNNNNNRFSVDTGGPNAMDFAEIDQKLNDMHRNRQCDRYSNSNTNHSKNRFEKRKYELLLDDLEIIEQNANNQSESPSISKTPSKNSSASVAVNHISNHNMNQNEQSAKMKKLKLMQQKIRSYTGDILNIEQTLKVSRLSIEMREKAIVRLNELMTKNKNNARVISESKNGINKSNETETMKMCCLLESQICGKCKLESEYCKLVRIAMKNLKSCTANGKKYFVEIAGDSSDDGSSGGESSDNSDEDDDIPLALKFAK